MKGLFQALLLVMFCDWVLHCSPGCPHLHVAQAGLERETLFSSEIKSSGCSQCAAPPSSFLASARPAAAAHSEGPSWRAPKSRSRPLHRRVLPGSGAAHQPAGRSGDAHTHPPFRAQLRPAAIPPPGAAEG